MVYGNIDRFVKKWWGSVGGGVNSGLKMIFFLYMIVSLRLIKNI